MSKEKTNEKSKIELVSLKDFLERTPPGVFKKIEDIHYRFELGSKHFFYYIPQIFIHCDNENCNGDRFFTPDKTNLSLGREYTSQFFITFTCKNCNKTHKLYALFLILDVKGDSCDFYKLGELPLFGPPTPTKLIELIGPDRDYFLLGRKCENQGLGIGAFTYYRRVVENQKNRIFDKIIDVANKVNPQSEVITELESAKSETQFSKAVENVKHAIPESLFIDGHNPLTLIHSALSEGVHNKTDKECLELASSIRVILSELSQKAAQVLKNDAEVASALSKLINRKNQQKTKK